MVPTRHCSAWYRRRICALNSTGMTKTDSFTDRDRRHERASALRGRDAGSLGASTATAPWRSASSAQRSARRWRRRRPARARWLARMKAVKHPGPASGNPGASRSCCCRRPSRRRRDPLACTIGVADAIAASARRARCGRPGCIGIDGLLGGASPRAPSASRRGRSSAGRGRSGCTAAPARGNAHTRTGGRDARPGSGLLGGKLPEATKTEPMPRCLRWTTASGNATLAPHSLLACVGYGVRLSLPG
jgi:hypothetical protein